MTLLLAAIPGHVLDPAKRPLVLLLIGFILTFAVVRLNTRLARAHGGSGLHWAASSRPGGFTSTTRSSASSACSSPASSPSRFSRASPWFESLAFVFGAGAALTLDEFALILHLEDVYWNGEGRKSHRRRHPGRHLRRPLPHQPRSARHRQAGTRPFLSRWVGLRRGRPHNVVFVVVCYFKGKLWARDGRHLRAVPSPFVGASSAREAGLAVGANRYAGDADKLERARRRDESFHQVWAAAEAPPVGPDRR